MNAIMKESSVKKAKTLFDHLKAVTKHQNPDYWDTLSDEDKKTWSNYMILRFLSMNPDWVSILSDMGVVIETLPPDVLYKLLINTIPKSNKYLKYVSSKKKKKYPDWLVEHTALFFEVSKGRALSYLDIWYAIDNGVEYVVELCRSFGMEDDKIKKVRRIYG